MLIFLLINKKVWISCRNGDFVVALDSEIIKMEVKMNEEIS